jgi:hypothetical protein
MTASPNHPRAETRVEVLHPLDFPVDGADRLALVPLTGAAEAAAEGDVWALLAALALPGTGRVGPEALGRLSRGDADRALAALYAALYGSRVVADARCTDCAARFELRFSLPDLAAGRRPDGSASGNPPAVAVANARLRLPLWQDTADSPDALIAALTLAGVPPPRAVAEAALEAADPALELDLAGECPDCGARQAVPFSMAGFLGAALRRDHGFLLREVHMIARAYGWSLAEILSLTRSARQGFVRLILADLGAAAAADPLRRAAG